MREPTTCLFIRGNLMKLVERYLGASAMHYRKGPLSRWNRRLGVTGKEKFKSPSRHLRERELTFRSNPFCTLIQFIGKLNLGSRHDVGLTHHDLGVKLTSQADLAVKFRFSRPNV
jgi:hypothetical protein